MSALFDFNLREILIYGKDDLLVASDQLAQALCALTDFGYYLQPLKRNLLLEDDPSIAAWKTSEGALLQLSQIPLFREALAREANSNGQSKNQQSQP